MIKEIKFNERRDAVAMQQDIVDKLNEVVGRLNQDEVKSCVACLVDKLLVEIRGNKAGVNKK